MKKVFLLLVLSLSPTASFADIEIEQTINLRSNTDNVAIERNGSIHSLAFKDTEAPKAGKKNAKLTKKEKTLHQSREILGERKFFDVIIFSVDHKAREITFIGGDGVFRTHRYSEGSRVSRLKAGDKVELELEVTKFKRVKQNNEAIISSVM